MITDNFFGQITNIAEDLKKEGQVFGIDKRKQQFGRVYFVLTWTQVLRRAIFI